MAKQRTQTAIAKVTIVAIFLLVVLKTPGCATVSGGLPEELGMWDERWRCSSIPSTVGPVTLLANKSGFGEVLFEGDRHPTKFEVQGLHRRWNWCFHSRPHEDPNLTYYNCAFIIGPNGRGSYFDFQATDVGEDTKASAAFDCRRIRLHPQQLERFDAPTPIGREQSRQEQI